MKKSALFVIVFAIGSAFLFACASFNEEPDAQALEHYHLAGDYAAQGQMNLAIGEYTKAIIIDPEYAPAYSDRGVAYRRIGDLEQAIADFDQAIALDPDFAFAYSNRGLVFAQKGDLDRAIADFDQAIGLAQYVNVYLARADVYVEKGDFDRAINDYSQAIALDPEYAFAYSIVGSSTTTKMISFMLWLI